MKPFKLNKNVYAAGIVSLFMDMSSEMIYPLMPLFLANVLGVNKSLIGLIEGVAESTASVLKVFSGWFSDKIGRRKGLMLAGYSISTLSRPIIALATGWHSILGGRFIDRLGKGVRTAPRDAIIAESTEQKSVGTAFGFHRSMDTIGAVVGPGLAFFLLTLFNEDYRKVFWASLIPGIIAVGCIIFFIKEKARPAEKPGHVKPEFSLASLNGKFKAFVLIVAIFSLGNSSDVFLILRAQQVGIPAVTIPIIYLTFNLVYSLSAVPAGMASDTFGRKRVIMAGFILFTAVYYGFAVANTKPMIWLLFAMYGIFMGLTEGVQKAYLATIIPAEFKATAFGIYNMALGLALLPASIIGGWLWDHVSPAATFYYGAATGLLSAVMFLVFSLMVGKEKR
jgi:MFS family permease